MSIPAGICERAYPNSLSLSPLPSTATITTTSSSSGDVCICVPIPVPPLSPLPPLRYYPSPLSSLSITTLSVFLDSQFSSPPFSSEGFYLMTPLPKTTSFNLPSPLLLALVHSHLSRSPYYFLLPCRYGVSSRVANTARNRVCVQSVSLLNLSKIWYRFRFVSYLTPSTEHKVYQLHRLTSRHKLKQGTQSVH